METALVVSSVLLWLVVLLNLVLTLALVRRLNTKSPIKSASPDVLRAGQPAPDFTAHTPDGETVTLASYAGRKVAFVFIETACTPCQELVPQLELLKPHAARAGVELALVSGNDMQMTLSFIEQLQVSLPVLVAPRRTNPFLETYKSIFTPAYCFIDEQGIVQSAGSPNQPGGSWEALAESWMQKGALATSERR